jgi:hypothetical protein
MIKFCSLADHVLFNTFRNLFNCFDYSDGRAFDILITIYCFVQELSNCQQR